MLKVFEKTELPFLGNGDKRNILLEFSLLSSSKFTYQN